MTEKFITEILGTPKKSNDRFVLSWKLSVSLRILLSELPLSMQSEFIYKLLTDGTAPKVTGIQRILNHSYLNKKIFNLFKSLHEKDEETYTKLLKDKKTKIDKKTINVHYNSLLEHNKSKYPNQSDFDIKKQTHQDFFELLNSHIIKAVREKNILMHITNKAVFEPKNDELLHLILELCLFYKCKLFYVNTDNLLEDFLNHDLLNSYFHYLIKVEYATDEYLSYKEIKKMKVQLLVDYQNINEENMLKLIKKLKDYEPNISYIESTKYIKKGEYSEALKDLGASVSANIINTFLQKIPSNHKEIRIKTFIKENKVAFVANLIKKYGI